MKIRPFETGDAPFIQKLNAEELGYEYPLQETREKLTALAARSCDRIFVAETDGQVVGYVHANDYDVIYAPHMKNLMGIAVSSDCKGRGIGRALLEKVEAWARQTEARGIRLVSGSTRTGAHEFYRRCGYSCGKRQLNFSKLFE